MLAGRIAIREEADQAARAYWQQAAAMLDPLLPDSRDWRLLEPAAEAHRLLGDLETARSLQRRLADIDFQTLDPLASRLSTDPSP